MEENKDIQKINVGPYIRSSPLSPIVRILEKISRNTVCPLTNKKFKHCCGQSGQNFCNKSKENLENYMEELKSNPNDKIG
jgi:hypothetical protein